MRKWLVCITVLLFFSVCSMAAPVLAETGGAAGTQVAADASQAAQPEAFKANTAYDESRNVRIETLVDRSSVGYGFLFKVFSDDGRRVRARIELTEGADAAALSFNGDWYQVTATKPGWITIKAWGTDGSSDSRRIQVCKRPTDIQISVPKQPIAPGKAVPINVTFTPADSWYPVRMGINDYENVPADTDLEGPVAVYDGHALTGLLAGKGVFELWDPYIATYDFTVAAGQQGLVFERPRPAFDWRKPFQLSVHDGTGRIIPATYTVSGVLVHVTADGLLTADQAGGYGVVTATLDSGVAYSFPVSTVAMPSWMKPTVKSLSIHLNESEYISGVNSDIGVLSYSSDWIMCSNDERIIRCADNQICPVSVGSATVTFWSVHNDVHCELPVTVTPPTDALYIKKGDELVPHMQIDLACRSSMTLPKLTDYYGNPVSVSWKITENKAGGGLKCVSLSGSKLTAIAGTGHAYVVATSSSGATFQLTVFPYYRASVFSLSKKDETIRVGGMTQIDLRWDTGNNGAFLSENDVVYSLSGDTGCVRWTKGFSDHQFYGLKPGTVTLTANVNGKKLTCVIHVVEYGPCANGHDLAWYETNPVGVSRNGEKEQRCSRCGLVTQTAVIPCTGVLGFSQKEFYLSTSGSQKTAALGTNLSGDRKQSFTWTSSDPSVVAVQADRITGLKAGTALITVVTGDCKPATCKVEVIDGNTIYALQLPRGMRVVKSRAFAGMKAASVIIPEGVTAIRSQAFANCRQLTLIQIPASVTFIADDAFTGSTKVVFACPPGSYAESYARKKGITVQ